MKNILFILIMFAISFLSHSQERKEIPKEGDYVSGNYIFNMKRENLKCILTLYEPSKSYFIRIVNQLEPGLAQTNFLSCGNFETIPGKIIFNDESAAYRMQGEYVPGKEILIKSGLAFLSGSPFVFSDESDSIPYRWRYPPLTEELLHQAVNDLKEKKSEIGESEENVYRTKQGNDETYFQLQLGEDHTYSYYCMDYLISSGKWHRENSLITLEEGPGRNMFYVCIHDTGILTVIKLPGIPYDPDNEYIRLRREDRF